MHLLFIAPSCGGRLYGSTGLLESPKFDRRYPFTITCTWILEVGPKSAIDFQLDTAKFDNSSCGSHLLFRETIDSTSKLIKKYCQDPGFTTFESQGNLVYIEHKIEKDKDSMFRFTWRERTDNSFRGILVFDSFLIEISLDFLSLFFLFPQPSIILTRLKC